MSFSRSVRAGTLALLFCALPALAHAETLREALTSAYLNNPTLMSALLNVKITAEGIVAAKAEKRPTIGATVNATESYTAGQSSLAGPTVQIGASINQNIFDNFKSEADLEAARAYTEASRYSLQNSEQTVLLAVVQAYFNIIQFGELVRVRQDNVTFYDATLQSANDRLKIGEGTKLDVSQARARLAQGTAAYQSAVSNLAAARATYERYVGHKPGKLTSSYKLGNLVPKSLDSAISEAVASHPAILAAKAGLRAAQANSDAADAVFGPTLDLVGSVASTVLSPSATSTPTPTGSVRLSLSIPIYAGGQYGSSIRKANLSQIKSEVDALATRDQVKESVVNAWETLRNAGSQIESANTGVSAAQLSLEGIGQERDVGQATTLDVLNAQSELESTRETLISATASRSIATFALVAATGHLTAADLSLDVEIKTGEDYIAKVEDVWAELRALD
jgi:outer membrane protein